MEKDKRRPVWDSADLIRDFDTAKGNEEAEDWAAYALDVDSTDEED